MADLNDENEARRLGEIFAPPANKPVGTYTGMDICSAYSRLLPLHEYYGIDAVQAVDELVHFRLPKPADITSLDDMERCTAKSLNAYDSPKIWEGLVDLAAQFREQGTPLTKAVLMEPSRDGIPRIYKAIVSGHMEQVLNVLKDQGERLEAAELVGSDGNPTSLLQCAIEEGQAGALFSTENWRGQPVGEMKRVYHAIPEEERGQVTNYHGLLASMMREEQVRTRGVGGKTPS